MYADYVKKKKNIYKETQHCFFFTMNTGKKFQEKCSL